MATRAVTTEESVKKGPTYSAYYQHDHSCIIYRHKPNDGTLDKLPQGAKPAEHHKSTFYRKDGGDPFQFAFFLTTRGQWIVVQRD